MSFEDHLKISLNNNCMAVSPSFQNLRRSKPAKLLFRDVIISVIMVTLNVHKQVVSWSLIGCDGDLI